MIRCLEFALRQRPMTAAAFAPFGEVIDSAGHTPMLINGGVTKRYHALARVELAGEGAQAILNLFDSQPYTLPMRLDSVERHPLGSQAFVPLQAQPFVVVVAHPVAEPPHAMPPENLRAFITNGQQGVNYHRGVWHHSLIALTAPVRFLVVDRGGPGANCDVVPIAGDVVLALDTTPSGDWTAAPQTCYNPILAPEKGETLGRPGSIRAA